MIETSPDERIAAAEATLERQAFWLRLVATWSLLSLLLTVSFGLLVVRGFASFPREAQYWCLGLSLVSLAASGITALDLKGSMLDRHTEIRQARAARRSLNAGTRAVMPVRERYRAEAIEYVEEARRQASRNRRKHSSFQVVIIVGSLLVTLLSGMGTASTMSWVTSGVSLLVSAAAGLSGFFKFRERGFNLQQTANAIEKEYQSLELQIRDYVMDREAALRIFAERVETLKEEQRNRELQLEQSSETTSRAIESAPPGYGAS